MLIIRDLVKVYPGPITALKGINLDIPNGMFGLLGPNGSGKSTLMKILAGLLAPTSGELKLDGHDVTTDPARIWPQLGYLPQDFGFYQNLSGEAMLLHLLRLKGVKAPGGLKRLCSELLERVNLSGAANRAVKTYSGGMKQRLGIAQAIAGNPRLIIVDEPTAGLDPQERMRFYRLLSELAEDRIVLLSTHIVEDVAVLCPQFAIIRQGQLLTTATPGKMSKGLEGTIYEGVMPQEAVAAHAHQVTKSYLLEGKHRIRLYIPDKNPPPGFVGTTPTLEDAYMLMQQGTYPALQAENVDAGGAL